MSRYPPLTQEQDSRVTKLVDLLQETYLPLPPQLQELQRLTPLAEEQKASTSHNPVRQYCYCFLISREWDLQKAFEMMQLTVRYRAEHRLDGQRVFPCAISCKGWDQEAIRKALAKGEGTEESLQPRPTDQRLDRLCAGIAPFFSYGFHKWDKFGQPVLYMMIGTVDEPGLLESLRHMANVGQSAEAVLWEVVLHILAVGESLQMYQQLQYSAGALKVDAADGLIRSATIVIDLKGLTYKMLWKPALDLFMNTLREIFKYYPQCMYQILIVNSPAMVMFAYKIVRGVLPPGVQQKVHIANEADTPEALKKWLDEDCLPDFYGGTCHCDGGCIHGFDPTKKEKTVTATETTDSASTAAHDEDERNGTVRPEFVETEDITLKAGYHHKRVFPLKNREKAVWEFVSSNARNVTFAKYFVPEANAKEVNWAKAQTSKLEPFLVSKASLSEGSDEYTAAADGVIVLVWDNRQSWFTAKHLQMKVFKNDN
ncbi:hypothetical protein ABB37_05867 [Leptomonas pyrrhocoris]|uniref:CRAL-TRIO domain-containing protein n=1 Tax=Leptomonas pyrrhocoris TaxID=157538 RepID=A0A0M9FYW0_LEPPY|nr:hypothetical protein ABB37_05867 [Leptomonas pyrrhocoris]KPA78749.1 hypothetical protein ABB37_05867 [Leptomonas pyrrhocoris]|eukprot:XP_015657188.1 hypothetical protein ABB37_05867 [Leptomonas pyrrhocoris]